MSIFDDKMLVINNVRVDPAEVIGYAHVYKAPTQAEAEESYVALYIKGGITTRIIPTSDFHSDSILARLDKHFGTKKP